MFCLQIVDGQHTELQQLRQYLRMCFAKISCYLMPHPGLTVATSPKFDGRLQGLHPLLIILFMHRGAGYRRFVELRRAMQQSDVCCWPVGQLGL
jgi:Guanylate-binding protein, N-terminal domain